MLPAKKNNVFNGFAIFVAIAIILTFTLNMVNGRFLLGDFKVYHTAAVNLISGDQVYLVSFYGGSGFYKYSPATLFFFLPYALFNFKTAAIIHFFILGLAYWYTFITIRKLIRDYFLIGDVKHEIWLLSISFGCILIHFTREMYLGNINIILLMLCCLSVWSFLTSKDLRGGILLGIVILAKPYLLILLLPLVLRKKWKALGWMCLTIVFGLILPFVYPGPQKSIRLYSAWIDTIRMHSGDFPGMTSLDFFIRNLIPSWPTWGIIVIFFSCCAWVVMFIMNNIHMEKQEGLPAGIADMNFLFEWFLVIALLPNLIKTDWVLLVFSAPLITFSIFYTDSRKKYWYIPLLVVFLFFYGANSDDLLGRKLSHTIMVSGLMGLGNFLIVMISMFMFLGHRKRTE